MTQNTILNIIGVLYDVQHLYVKELQPDLKHQLKQITNQADNSISKLIRFFDRINSQENAENFGIASDMIKEMIDKMIENERTN